jgi:hypothetical protein
MQPLMQRERSWLSLSLLSRRCFFGNSHVQIKKKKFIISPWDVWCPSLSTLKRVHLRTYEGQVPGSRLYVGAPWAIRCRCNAHEAEEDAVDPCLMAEPWGDVRIHTRIGHILIHTEDWPHYQGGALKSYGQCDWRGGAIACCEEDGLSLDC